MVSEQTCTLSHKMDTDFVTEDLQDLSHTFIIQETTVNIVTCEMQHSIVDWVCSKLRYCRRL